MAVNSWDEVARRVVRPSPAAMAETAQAVIGAQLERIAPQSDAKPKAAQAERTSAAESFLPSSVTAVLSGGQGLAQAAQSIVPGGGSRGGGGILSTIAGGFGVGPIISGLIHLFGGGGKPEPPPLVRFELPEAVSRVESAGVPGGSVAEVSYGQNGLPRAVGGGQATQQPITVNVQAMDSKSFLDHSEDIARAVRDAMLYSHSLNDVVTEL